MRLSGIALLVAIGFSSPAAQAAKTVTYYYSDPQGTPLAKADGAGNITGVFDYHPYGADASNATVGERGIAYTGHVADEETDLIYMQARFYDPGTGRFLSLDPQGMQAAVGNIFFANRFAYANNSPIRYSDDHGDRPGDHFRSPQAAALDALKYINDRSIAENAEFQGYIVVSGENDFIATEPVRLSIDGGSTDATPPGAIGDYHTHGDWTTGTKGNLVRTNDPSKDSVNSAHFSKEDIARYIALASMLGHQYRGYLGTPARSYLFFDATTRASGDLQKVVDAEQKAWEEKERIRQEMSPDRDRPHG